MELPRWMVFVHGHNSSEHMPDKVSVLRVSSPRGQTAVWISSEWIVCPAAAGPVWQYLQL